MKLTDFANMFVAATGVPGVIQETKNEVRADLTEAKQAATIFGVTTLSLQAIATVASVAIATVTVLNYINRNKRRN